MKETNRQVPDSNIALEPTRTSTVGPIIDFE